MAYVKTVWETGDTITKEKLNHMEAGIYGALELHLIFNEETSVTSIQGAEVQAIATATPDKVIDISDGLTQFYRLNQITELGDSIYIVYACDNSSDGDRQSIKYMWINCDLEGVVNGFATGLSNASSSGYDEFTYNSATECWEYGRN